MGVQGHHSLCHPHPLRAGFWPCAGPSPPPRADFVQKQGHGRDSLEKPPPHPATGLWWHLEEDRKTHSGSGWLLGLVLCFREARAGLEAFREALRAGLPWQDPRGCRPASGPPATWDPGTCPVMSSHPSVASPPSTPPPPLSWVPSAVGATSLLLRACPHWALPGTPRPHPRAPSRAVCSSHLLQQGPHPASSQELPPCLAEPPGGSRPSQPLLCTMPDAPWCFRVDGRSQPAIDFSNGIFLPGSHKMPKA